MMKFAWTPIHITGDVLATDNVIVSWTESKRILFNYGITLRRAFMKGYFSGECSHRVCVDGIKKNHFSNKNDSCGRGLAAY